MSIRIGNRIISGGAGGGNGDSLTNQNLSSEITQIYNWVGTYAEYVDQDVANAHPEWVCYITDDEFGEDEELEIYQITARNVGDIFFTSRKDNWLNGAVECDGKIYNISDFEGAESIGNLLKSGKLPYVSFTQYDELLTANGSVGVFGWNGLDYDAFKVPTLNDLFLETGKANQLGQFVSAGLPNITGTWDGNCHNLGYMHTSGAIYKSGDTYGGLSAMDSDNTSLGIDASRSSSIYGNSDTVQPNAVRYRAMVQLSTGFNDEAIDTCREVREDVNKIKSYITNCITEIPQDIKLELNNGVLTLKAGSKIYIPDGFESDGVTKKFTPYTLSEDNLITSIGNGTQIETLCIRVSNGVVSEISDKNTYSGDTTPTVDPSSQYAIWYDTSVNRIKRTTDTGATWTEPNASLPIALINMQDSVITNIVQIFNGIGYIGTCLYALPGISYLLPDGRTEDGNYKNLAITTEKVTIHNFTTLVNRYLYVNLNKSGEIDYHGYGYNDFGLNLYRNRAHFLVYDTYKNKYYQSNENSRYFEASDMIVGVVHFNSTYIDKLELNITNNSFDTYYKTDHSVINFQEPTANNNYTWYRLYSDGWVEQGGTSSDGQTSPVTINLPITMLNGKYQIQLTAMMTSGDGTYVSSRIATVRNDNNYTNEVSSFKYIVSTTTGSSAVKVNWEVKGMAA